MKHTWKIIGDRFEALNERERWMVFCALFVVVFASINILLLNPVLEQKKVLSNGIAMDQAQTLEIKQQMDALARQQVVDPDAQNKQRITELQAHLQQLETKFSSLQTTLISPDKIPALLRSLLKKNSTLKLIALKTLPAKGLLENSPEDMGNVETSTSTMQDAPVFKHGVEITIEGRYLELLEYVSEMEKMPWHLLWSKASLNAEHYPECQLTLTVYTLSLDQNWLSI